MLNVDRSIVTVKDVVLIAVAGKLREMGPTVILTVLAFTVSKFVPAIDTLTPFIGALDVGVMVLIVGVSRLTLKVGWVVLADWPLLF